MLRIAGTPDKKYIMISVRNVGKTRTTIRTIAFSTFDSWWNRRRLKRCECGIAPNPIGATLPSTIDVGEQWVGMFTQEEMLVRMLRTGTLFCEVYHSWKNRPVMVKIAHTEALDRKAEAAQT
jgi:hypothetical protein